MTEALPRGWRLVTAVRVFALAWVTGLLLAHDTFRSGSVGLAALALVAGIVCASEYDPDELPHRWTPLLEGVLATGVVAAAGHGPAAHLAGYLAVPALVAGTRYGRLVATNVFLASLAVLAMTASAGGAFHVPVDDLLTCVSWLLLGLGSGFFAAAQTRSIRDLEAAQAPLVEAHRLLTGLRALAENGEISFDPREVANELIGPHADGAEPITAIAVTQGDHHLLLAATGDLSDGHHQLLQAALETGRVASSASHRVEPLVVAGDTVGALLLEGGRVHPSPAETTARETAALRLSTALLFEEVRQRATAQERHRLARDIHDGIAQEIVALGYLVDDIAATSAEPETLRTATSLRHEISRVVAELRFSIFDLRHEVAEPYLSGALTEYVHTVSSASDVRVHLVLDEQGPPLPGRTREEVLRVAQEAISNVRKHARADNLWVTLVSDGATFTLEISDDGVGDASPRTRHYGLHTMRERAERVAADFSLTRRDGGGTLVRLTTNGQRAGGDEVDHEHHGAARR